MNKNNDLTISGAPASLELATIDSLEITPLSDDELGAVAGGFTDHTTHASCSCCVAGATEVVVILPGD